MRIARVVGQIVSTVADSRFDGHKLLLVQPVDDQARPADTAFVAVDAAQAGVGDYVLVVQEGKSARQVMDSVDAPCEAIVVGVIDHVQTGGRQRVLRAPEQGGPIEWSPGEAGLAQQAPAFPHPQSAVGQGDGS